MIRQWQWWMGGLLVLVVVGVTLLWLQEPTSTRLLTRLFARQDSTWAEMQARGTWRVGMDPSFPPFEYLDESGANSDASSGLAVGYDVDLARLIADEWGLQAEIVPIGYDSLADALQAGRIDSVVSAFPLDTRLTRDLWFSPPYFEAGLRLVVRADSTISSTANLQGSTVAVEWGSLGDMLGRQLQREGIALQLRPFATPAEAVAALQSDTTLDALLVDQVSLRLAQGEGAMLVAVGPPLESNAYVVAAPLRAYDLHARIAETLLRFATDGTLAEVEARWFGALPPGLARE
jgi:polar amino acid transport system substrate-binding protein